MVFLYLLVAILLLLLNAFFVLAEFAAVKNASFEDRGNGQRWCSRAIKVRQVHQLLDEYLSVCQLGITFASIGLGFVAEPAVVKLVEPIVLFTGIFPEHSTAQWLTAHSVAFTISYLLVSFMHILLGS